MNKLCRNCKHRFVYISPLIPLCFNDKCLTSSQGLADGYTYCCCARDKGKPCGLEGKLFEEKLDVEQDSFWSWFKGFIGVRN